MACGCFKIKIRSPQCENDISVNQSEISNCSLQSLNNNRQGNVAVLPLRFSELDPGNLRGVEKSGSGKQVPPPTTDLLDYMSITSKARRGARCALSTPLRQYRTTAGTSCLLNSAFWSTRRCRLVWRDGDFA